ncbi:helix-turn-helix domain-containing protein [Sphingomonas rubra]|uniref:Helix-turn-helix domain-containing protein n=1 Tax=Sphingomonas rubra TaxID=634430 RepID=A0A1I5SAI8_9SPHN|nr:helix-turn-helix transcriptional regulator [Sphingomonas rubra]SFP67722.1 Helix-turn-helix domain-containing protein [Sphingomonas rubra]
MITAIREVRRARGLTLEEVALACVPPTTAQTIGRLETGTRTVSVAWLNRIAAALGVAAADLVRLPERAELPVAALLDERGAQAPRAAATVTPPVPTAGMVAVAVRAATGDYRPGDELWCEMLAPDRFVAALGRDVLAPVAAGRFAFGRLAAVRDDAVDLLPPAGAPVTVAAPAWLARAVRLVRAL